VAGLCTGIVYPNERFLHLSRSCFNSCDPDTREHALAKLRQFTAYTHLFNANTRCPVESTRFALVFNPSTHDVVTMRSYLFRQEEEPGWKMAESKFIPSISDGTTAYDGRFLFYSIVMDVPP